MAAEAAISRVLQLLGDVFFQEVKFICGVKGKVETLKVELTRMQIFLNAANKKQVVDDIVQNCIREIRELAFDAEDAIEMFALNVETDNSRGLFQVCERILNYLRCLHKIGEEIQEILDRLANIRASQETWRIIDRIKSGEPAGRSKDEVRHPLRLSPWHEYEHPVGMEDHVEKLLEQIMDQESKGLSMVAIEGMGGIGKSTLARELYNHPGVIHFDCRAWVVVSSEFTPLETIKQLILETSKSGQEKKERLEEMKNLEGSFSGEYLEGKLKKMLYKQLERKTYFIILDDVWEKEHFKYLLKNIFPNEKDKESILLFTTRNKDIANQCGIRHEMEFLDSKKSWKLFLNKGLLSSREEFTEKLEHKSGQNVKKCEGLPLEIIVMGGLLAEIWSHKNKRQDALSQLDSHLPSAKRSISAILELSYQNLSSELRYCFLCLAFFNEDATIPVKRLVNIMVEQDLIKNTGKEKMEEKTVRDNLDKLINWNMVQVTRLSLNNQIKSCHLHDCLRDICLQKAKEEIGLEVLKGAEDNSLEKPRHCIVQCDGPVSFSTTNKKHIRSLFLYRIKEIEPIDWKSFQHLKNLDLDLDGNFRGMRQFPNSFRSLHGLKQLRMCGDYCGEIDLPPWLSTLKRLKILDLSGWQVKFPNVALEMNSLRHIYARCIIGLKITDSWKNIETIKVVSNKDWMRNNLRMQDVSCHTLGIRLDDSDDEDREEESPSMGVLENLTNLVELYIICESHYKKVIVISHLINLTKLKLNGHGMECLRTSKFPPSLLHLTLCGTRLSEDQMQELSKLPKLSYLKLKRIPHMSGMQVLRNHFLSLEGLLLKALPDLISVEIKEGGMPQLKLFQVYECPDLDTKNLSNKSYQLQIIQ